MNNNELLNKVNKIREQLNDSVIGQEHLIEALLISYLCKGHLLIEGLPGLAKTRAVKKFSEAVSSQFGRIPFTPDMLPSDITGNDIFNPDEHNFQFRKGPVFTNILLADEINRAPAKVQAALLEAMQEKQVTINGNTYSLPEPFVVMATQNPQDQEGTFLLPEAQKDRFLMNVILNYPGVENELHILKLVRSETNSESNKNLVRCTTEEITAIRNEIDSVYVSEVIDLYIVKLVQATRMDNKDNIVVNDLKNIISYGAGPRASISLDLCSRAVAWLSGRDYVTGDDVKSIAKDVLRHRIKLSLRAVHEGWTIDKALDILLQKVTVA